MKSTQGKFLHLLHAIARWVESAAAIHTIHSLVTHVMEVAGNGSHGQMLESMLWAHHHLAPVISHVATAALQLPVSVIRFDGETEALESSAWQYGGGNTGGISKRSLAGFPHGGHGSNRGTGTMTHGHVPKVHAPKGPKVHIPNKSGQAGLNVRKPNVSLHHRLEADTGGEPMTGNMGHWHIDPLYWFHPPSLSKRNSNESLRVPADNPGEKKDTMLDKTNRDSKGTRDFRMKLLKRSTPGGLPAQIPARTTLVVPHTAAYMPSGITALYGAARARRSARLGYKDRRGMFVSFKNRGRI